MGASQQKLFKVNSNKDNLKNASGNVWDPLSILYQNWILQTKLFTWEHLFPERWKFCEFSLQSQVRTVFRENIIFSLTEEVSWIWKKRWQRWFIYLCTKHIVFQVKLTFTQLQMWLKRPKWPLQFQNLCGFQLSHSLNLVFKSIQGLIYWIVYIAVSMMYFRLNLAFLDAIIWE